MPRGEQSCSEQKTTQSKPPPRPSAIEQTAGLEVPAARALEHVRQTPMAAIRPGDILSLQRNIGNQAVQRLLQNKRPPPTTNIASIQRIPVKYISKQVGELYHDDSEPFNPFTNIFYKATISTGSPSWVLTPVRFTGEPDPTRSTICYDPKRNIYYDPLTQKYGPTPKTITTPLTPFDEPFEAPLSPQKPELLKSKPLSTPFAVQPEDPFTALANSRSAPRKPLSTPFDAAPPDLFAAIANADAQKSKTPPKSASLDASLVSLDAEAWVPFGPDNSAKKPDSEGTPLPTSVPISLDMLLGQRGRRKDYSPNKEHGKLRQAYLSKSKIGIKADEEQSERYITADVDTIAANLYRLLIKEKKSSYDGLREIERLLMGCKKEALDPIFIDLQGDLKPESGKVNMTLDEAITHCFGKGEDSKYLLDILDHGRPTLYAQLLRTLRKLHSGYRGPAVKTEVLALIKKASKEDWDKQKEEIQRDFGRDFAELGISESIFALQSYKEAVGEENDKSQVEAQVAYLLGLIKMHVSRSSLNKTKLRQTLLQDWLKWTTAQQREALMADDRLRNQIQGTLTQYVKEQDKVDLLMAYIGGGDPLPAELLVPLEEEDEEALEQQATEAQEAGDKIAMLNALLEAKKLEEFGAMVATLTRTQVNQFLGNFLKKPELRREWMNPKTSLKRRDDLFSILQDEPEALLMEAIKADRSGLKTTFLSTESNQKTSAKQAGDILYNLRFGILGASNLRQKSNYRRLTQLVGKKKKPEDIRKQLALLSPHERLTVWQNAELRESILDLVSGKGPKFVKEIEAMLGGKEQDIGAMLGRGETLTEEEAMGKAHEGAQLRALYWTTKLKLALNRWRIKQDAADVVQIVLDAQAAAQQAVKSKLYGQESDFLKQVFGLLDAEYKQRLESLAPKIYSQLSNGENLSAEALRKQFKGKSVLGTPWYVNANKKGDLITIKSLPESDFLAQLTDFSEFQEMVDKYAALATKQKGEKLPEQDEQDLALLEAKIAAYTPKMNAAYYKDRKSRLDTKDFMAFYKAWS
ncbi:MAG: hypothetical protein H0T73_19805, partial [Ardenticatenales bacterium]|nr:hypothetical protein [Ardenticatenales bacterium]